MNFELGKKYIVEVTEKGIIPREEFLEERYIDKDHDDLDFLTDEEKTVIVNGVLDKIRAEIEQLTSCYSISKERGGMGQVEWSDRLIKESDVLQIIDKYRKEQE